MDAADPNVSQRAAREKADSGGFMKAKSQYGMWGGPPGPLALT
jgi:hypothetical protein